MKRTKLLALLMALVLMLGLLAACGTADRPGLEDDSDTPDAGNDAQNGDEQGGDENQDEDWIRLVVGSESSPQSFSPVINSWGNSEYLVDSMVYESLATMNEDMELVGICAKEWTQLDEEGLEYEIEIYDYIHDIDGNHITADDIVFCYQNALNQNFTNLTRFVESAEKTGDYTVKIRLTGNTIESLSSALINLRVYSQAAYEASEDKFATRPIGTTHYRMTEFEPGGNIVVTRNDGEYWQTDESLWQREQYDNVDEVEIVSLTESSQQSIAIETGEINMMRGMNAAVVDRFLDNPDYKIFEVQQIMTRGIYFSGEAGKPTADNQLLRQAICHAIDRQGIVDIVMGGRATVTSSFTSSQAIGFNQKWLDEELYEYDPDLARDLLAQAGYEPGELTLTFLTNSSDEWSRVAQVVQSYLLEIGINVEIQTLEGAIFGTMFNDGTQFDMTIDQIGGNYYSVIVNSKMGQSGYGGKSKTGFVDNELEELIQICRYADATEEDYDNLHYYLQDQAYSLPLYDSLLTNVVRADAGVQELVYSYRLQNLLNATVFE